MLLHVLKLLGRYINLTAVNYIYCGRGVLLFLYSFLYLNFVTLGYVAFMFYFFYVNGLPGWEDYESFLLLYIA